MPKQTTKTTPPTRDLIITHSRTNTSTLGEQIAQGSDVILATPIIEQRTPTYRYILISPTLGPITIEQLLKHNSDNGVDIRTWFSKQSLH